VPEELVEPLLAPGDAAPEPEPDIDPEAEPDAEPVVESVDELGDVVLDDDELGDDVDGDVAVGGDADGVRSPGRSPTRSVRVSVHAVARVAISASAENPANARFMKRCPPVRCIEPLGSGPSPQSCNEGAGQEMRCQPDAGRLLS